MKVLALLSLVIGLLAGCSIPKNPSISFGKKCAESDGQITYSYLWVYDKEVGLNGFGYDPLFYLPELNVTSAELASNEKHKISHRGRALMKFSDFFSDYINENK